MTLLCSIHNHRDGYTFGWAVLKLKALLWKLAKLFLKRIYVILYLAF